MGTSSQRRRQGRAPWSVGEVYVRTLLVTGVLPALLLAATLLAYDYSLRRGDVAQSLAVSANLAAQQVEEFIGAHGAAVALQADAGSDDWDAALARTQRRYPAFITMLATDAGGTIVAAAPARLAEGLRAGRIDVSDRTYFRRPMQSGLPYVSNAFRGRGFGSDALIAVSAPIRGDGGWAGVVEGSIRAEAFAKARGAALRDRGWEMLVFDRAGVVIHASAGLSHAPLTEGRQVPALRTMLDALPGDMWTVATSLPRDGSAYAVAADNALGWRVVVLAPRSQVLMPMLRDAMAVLALFLVLLASALLAARRLSRRVGRAVTGIEQRMESFAFEAAPASLEIADAPRELAQLPRALNHLASRLNQAYQRIQRALDEQSWLSEQLEEVVRERDDEIARRTEELRKAVAALDEQSQTDALTGALNYRGFENAMRTAWRRSAQDGAPVVALAIDVDHFKAYNDRYGHPMGDATLRRVVGAVRSAVHGAQDILARVGGEEFVVVLPGAEHSVARIVAERVRIAVADAGIRHGAAPAGVVTISIGAAAAVPAQGGEPSDLLSAADQALYRAKRGGRNRVVVAGV